MNSQFQEFVQIAKKQSTKLLATKNQFRCDILAVIYQKLKAAKQQILQENLIDQKYAKTLLAQGKINQSVFDRMCLNEQKFAELMNYPRTVSKLEDPIKTVQYHYCIKKDLELKRYSVPLGVLMVIFESRPEVLVQISSLAIKSGNGVLLKGGSEANQTNKILFSIIDQVLETFQLQGLIHLLETRKDIDSLLKEKNIDLIIPRGSKQLVEHIQNNTKTPVMGHADGICHIFVDKSAEEKKAIQVILDSKCQYPAVCNAVETLLLHKNLPEQLMLKIFLALQKNNVELRIEKSLVDFAKRNKVVYQLATEKDWNLEYTDKILSIKQVASLEEAIWHIQNYGSQHTECIITENAENAEQFLWEVDAAGVFHNASTRFADGQVYGLGAEVGVSTNKLHARGPVGLEGLMSYKYILIGKGHTIAKYKKNQ